MASEIEHKYLVIGSFKELAKNKIHIRQGYLSADKSRTIRVRQADDKAFLTIKGPSTQNGLERYEFEMEIPAKEVERLFELCLPGAIEKIRYLIPLEKGLVCEVDEFLRENKGLIMAEVEVSHQEEHFTKPSFLGMELTGDRRFYNSYLSRQPFASWKDEFINNLDKKTKEKYLTLSEK